MGVDLGVCDLMHLLDYMNCVNVEVLSVHVKSVKIFPVIRGAKCPKTPGSENVNTAVFPHEVNGQTTPQPLEHAAILKYPNMP